MPLSCWCLGAASLHTSDAQGRGATFLQPAFLLAMHRAGARGAAPLTACWTCFWSVVPAAMQGVTSFRRRSLLATTYLSNVADVTMEMNTGSTSAVSGVNTSVVDAVADGTLAVSSCWKHLP